MNDPLMLGNQLPSLQSKPQAFVWLKTINWPLNTEHIPVTLSSTYKLQSGTERETKERQIESTIAACAFNYEDPQTT